MLLLSLKVKKDPQDTHEFLDDRYPTAVSYGCGAGALNNAITCTILAAAGPQRSRMLSQLYKDERSAVLPVWPFLEKVYLERILRK